jgi:protein regulator of cytokinesis 1
MQMVIQSCRSITELIPQREQLRKSHEELEALHQDPTRLLSRRGGKSLIEEQKLEARVKRELPPLEKQILGLIATWEAQNGKLRFYFIRCKQY